MAEFIKYGKIAKKYGKNRYFLVVIKFNEPLKLLYAWKYIYYTIILNFYRLEKILKKFYERKTLQKREKRKKMGKRCIFRQVRTKGIIFGENTRTYFLLSPKD